MLDFLGDMFDVRPGQIARAKQPRLLPAPGEEILIVEWAFRGHLGKFARLRGFVVGKPDFAIFCLP
jgi:hypothetical protein